MDKDQDKKLEELISTLASAVDVVFKARLELLKETKLNCDEMYQLLDNVTNGEISDVNEIKKAVLEMKSERSEEIKEEETDRSEEIESEHSDEIESERSEEIER